MSIADNVAARATKAGDRSEWQPHDGLLTDLYQLTMLDAYLDADMYDEAVFEFFIRRLPENRSFLMVAGLEQLLDYFEGLSFSSSDIEWLESTSRFSPRLIDYLRGFRFRGTIRAMGEGTLCFENEPIVQVVASLPEAQLVETRLINLIHFPTLIASKAARCVLVAPGKILVDFGLRRAHGAEAGLMTARASYIAGFAGTSTVSAEAEFGIPIYGTMAHSFVQAHSSEIAAFEHFATTYPEDSVLLIDTYDTLAAARAVTRLVHRLRPQGIRVRAVRLDSGDLPALTVEVRKILDDNNCKDISIFCSGSIDEYVLASEFRNIPADGFGIGTHLAVSADAPYLDCAYKIQEYAGTPRRKRSAGKATWPGRKQIYRRRDPGGLICGDNLVEFGEKTDGKALLETVMRDGKRVAPSPDLSAVRRHAASELSALPAYLRGPFARPDYPVDISDRIKTLADSIDRTVQSGGV